ncbi:MAG: hypothetical protein [Olavius algarvensis Gamma 3 endosymbiont]|nr:MAG: hypothetical protein [Olavius algarvensis Gamma 3 endosymbiont]
MEIRFPNTSSTVGIMIYSGQQCAQAGILKSWLHDKIPACAGMTITAGMTATAGMTTAMGKT